MRQCGGGELAKCPSLVSQAEKSVKILLAFKVYDFDNDGYISSEDIAKLLALTTGKAKGENSAKLRGSMSTPPTPGRAQSSTDQGSPTPRDAPTGMRLDPETVEEVISSVMLACDLDGRGGLSFTEFNRVMVKMADLPAKFSVNIRS